VAEAHETSAPPSARSRDSTLAPREPGSFPKSSDARHGFTVIWDHSPQEATVTTPFVQPTESTWPAHPRRWRYVVGPMLLLVMALTGPAYYLYASSQPVIGANIGAALGLGWAWVCGMPWSLLVSDPAVNTDATLDRLAILYMACALFNVALIGLVSALLYRRRRVAQSP